MADPCATYTYSTVTINGAETTDTLITPDFDSIVGLDGKPVRRQVDPASQEDGDLDLQEAYFGGREITFKGLIHIGTLGTGSIDVTNPLFLQRIITLQKTVVAALEATLTTGGTLAWTDATGAARSIACKYGLPGRVISFGGTLTNPTFEFTLWAPDPDIV